MRRSVSRGISGEPGLLKTKRKHSLANPIGKRDVFLSALLAAATIALYCPVIGHPFVILDDNQYVVGNSYVRDGLSWTTIKWAFASTTAANWHPVTWLSHALDCQIFGPNPAGHHADSVIIHAINAVLLFFVLRWITSRAAPSLLVSFIFAWHPLNVESVAWIAERKNVLSTLFFLGAIAAYAWYAQKPTWQRYLTLAILFSLGLMAKPMVITLPFVLLLLDFWPLHRTPASPPAPWGTQKVSVSRLWLEKIPLLALSGASAMITLNAQRSAFAVRSLYQFPLAVRIENAIVAYSVYIWKMLWPSRLAVLYPYPVAGPSRAAWISSGLFLLLVSILVLLFRSRRWLVVGWLWFLGTLVPVIGLVQVGDQAMADRYAYVPLIGLFVMVAWAGSDLANYIRMDSRWRIAAAGCGLAALAIVTFRQSDHWSSEFDLWAHTVAVTDKNPVAQDALAAALMQPELALSAKDVQEFETDEQRVGQARELYLQGLALCRELAQQNPGAYIPDVAYTLINLGNLERAQSNIEKARQYFHEAVQIHARLMESNLDPYPEDAAVALTNLGDLEKNNLQNQEAAAHFANALEIYRKLSEKNAIQYLSNVADALNNLAITARDAKQMRVARLYYQQLLPVRRRLVEQNRNLYLPSLAATLNDLGILDGIENQNVEALQYYKEAEQVYRELAQDDAKTYVPLLAGTLGNLAMLYRNQNRPQESSATYNEALQLYQDLSRTDPIKYAGDVARVEADLAKLRDEAN